MEQVVTINASCKPGLQCAKHRSHEVAFAGFATEIERHLHFANASAANSTAKARVEPSEAQLDVMKRNRERAAARGPNYFPDFHEALVTVTAQSTHDPEVWRTVVKLARESSQIDKAEIVSAT